MACYGIFDVEITDLALYETYKAGTETSIKAAGGKYLVRGGETELLEGEPSPHRIIVLEFPTKAAFDAWYHGAEYARSLPLRLKSARTRAFSVVGI